MNEFLIELQAKLNEAKSAGNINSDISALQDSIDKLKVKAEIDPKALSDLSAQIEKAFNKKIEIQNIGINQGNVAKESQKIGAQIGQQVQAGINKAVQKGNFQKSFSPNKNNINNTAKDAENYFKTLSNIVSVEEKLGKNNNLTGFTVSLKNAEGVVEQLNYKYKELTDGNGKINRLFEYSGGSINDNGVIRQINAITKKADDLQVKLDKLKANYSDKNSSSPIKDSGNIALLSQQYDKVAQAIGKVRDADNSTLSSMVSNAQREMAALESMVSQFKNAENVATHLKSVDLSSGISQAQERFGKLKIDSSGFKQMEQTIKDLDHAIANVGDKSSLDALIDKLRVAEAQLSRVRAEERSMAQANKIQYQVDTGDYEAKVESLIAKTNQWTDNNGNARISTNNLSTALHELTEASNAYANNKTAATQEKLVASCERLDAEYKKVGNSVKKMNAEFAKDSAIASLKQSYQRFYDLNTRSHMKFGAQIKSAMKELDSGAAVTNKRFQELKQNLVQINTQARQMGKLGKGFFQTIKEGARSFSYWTSSTFLVMKAIQSVKSGINTVKELDTSLVDLKKTTTMTNSELEGFYYDANSTAKEMGVSTKEIIDQASAWSRLGFSSAEAATQMAKYSSQFASISPGMDLDSATDGLVSVMKAFKIGLDDTDEVVDGIMSKINIIGNNKALNNSDIVEFLRRSSSAMAEANNSLEETIALGEAAVEITRDASNTGQVLKTTSMRVRGYDEETSSYTEELENLKGEIADLTKTAKTPGGISLFTDDTKETYKSTYKIIEEISEIWDDLTDKNQAKQPCLYVQKCA